VSGLDVAGVDVATLLVDLGLLVDKAVVEVRSEVRGASPGESAAERGQRDVLAGVHLTEKV
jgi:hypothetical protein